MMKLCRNKRHYYDGNKYSQCPECRREGSDSTTPSVKRQIDEVEKLREKNRSLESANRSMVRQIEDANRALRVLSKANSTLEQQLKDKSRYSSM